MLTEFLRRLEPFAELDREALTTVAQHARVLELPKGRALVRRGRTFARDVYLLKGEVLRDGATQKPSTLPVYRRGEDVDITTQSNVRLLAVDIEPIGFLLNRPRLPSPTLGAIEPWLDRLFSAPVLEPLGASDWQLLLRLGDDRQLGRGDILALDDRVYVVKRGAVACGDKRLGPGDFFGEDVVLSGAVVSAHVVTAQAGSELFSVPGAAIRALVEDYRTPKVLAEGPVEVIDLSRIGLVEVHRLIANLPRGAVVEIVGGDVGSRAWVFTTLTQAGFHAKPVRSGLA